MTSTMQVASISGLPWRRTATWASMAFLIAVSVSSDTILTARYLSTLPLPIGSSLIDHSSGFGYALYTFVVL